MNRRQLIKSSALSLAAAGIGGPAILFQVACGSTKQLVAWTATVIGALKDVSPILGEMGAASIVTLIARAIPIVETLKKAFQDNDNASALDALNNLINPQTGAIVEIANAVGALANDGRKRLVLGLLAIAQVALRLIAAQIEDDVPVADAANARRARPSAAGAVGRAAQPNALAAAFQASRF